MIKKEKKNHLRLKINHLRFNSDSKIRKIENEEIALHKGLRMKRWRTWAVRGVRGFKLAKTERERSWYCESSWDFVDYTPLAERDIERFDWETVIYGSGVWFRGWERFKNLEQRKIITFREWFLKWKGRLEQKDWFRDWNDLVSDFSDDFLFYFLLYNNEEWEREI